MTSRGELGQFELDKLQAAAIGGDRPTTVSEIFSTISSDRELAAAQMLTWIALAA